MAIFDPGDMAAAQQAHILAAQNTRAQARHIQLLRIDRPFEWPLLKYLAQLFDMAEGSVLASRFISMNLSLEIHES